MTTSAYKAAPRYEMPSGFVDAVGAAGDTFGAPENDLSRVGKAATKSELVNAMAAKSGLTKAVLSKAYDVLVEVMVEELTHGRTVRVAKFGSFKKRRNYSRTPKRAQDTASVDFVAGSHLVTALEESDRA
ncbi:HU family DNA-binding protein [Brevundimonas sp. A19_0]|uniref:HU family DNA-binding protein n=1 Tax=Brevundimonas sp. A19_0 TaxID=2821087 RepID=UPI001AD9DDE3|nr:HU family DNA-binding protein [Brevundimonas sp. A19_0]MBO9501078.1 HU family DNA-binding protein [Brevundimonas sp. A19_0]